MPFNLPNVLTWLRILAIPLLVAVFYAPATWLTAYERNLIATILFAAAAFTDWLDGYIARRLNQTSAFGAFLDPVADKLMVAAALIVLVQLGRVDAIVAFIIIGREIAISALREWMAKVGRAKSVAVNFLGKVKTASQLVAIPMLLYHDPIGRWFDPSRVGTWLVYLAATLTLVSMLYYLKLAAPQAFARGEGA
jgi:CDP-diacylglycerol--glycerol-3-phosphate 3-phosphatidyltransferase/cardiolipin synthase